jgi:hypothetical protein
MLGTLDRSCGLTWDRPVPASGLLQAHRMCPCRDDRHALMAFLADSIRRAEAGREAAGGVMSEIGHSPVHGIIDQRTVDWIVAPVRHTIG